MDVDDPPQPTHPGGDAPQATNPMPPELTESVLHRIGEMQEGGGIDYHGSLICHAIQCICSYMLHAWYILVSGVI